jgi:hypothetical protein
MAYDTHFLELIYHWKQNAGANTFKSVSDWYEKHYAMDAERHVYDILSILTNYMERNKLIHVSWLIKELKPGQWYYASFSDLTPEQNEKLEFRVLAMCLSKLRITEVVMIPGFREYVDNLVA